MYQKIIKEINKNTLGTILEAMQYKNFLRAMKVLSRWKLLTAHGWDSSPSQVDVQRKCKSVPNFRLVSSANTCIVDTE